MQQKFINITLPSKKIAKMSFLEWGNAANETIICVHGLTRNGQDFNRIAGYLQNDFHVLCPDMFGRGNSDYLENIQEYQYITYLSACIQLLDYYNIRKTHWLGTSMGGIIGMMAACSYSERIISLIINDIGKIISAEGLKRIFSHVGSNKKTMLPKKELESMLRKNCQSFGLQTENEWQEFLDISIKPEGEEFTLNYDPEIIYPYKTGDFTKITDINLTEIWEGVACLTLIIRGAESDILTHKTAMEMTKKDGVKLIELPNIGHAPAIMNEEQIKIVAEFYNLK